MTTDIQNKLTATEALRVQKFALLHFRMEAMNYHGKALYELCRFIGDQTTARKVHLINELQTLECHLPYHLGKYRDELSERIRLRVEGDFPDLHAAMMTIF